MYKKYGVEGIWMIHSYFIVDPVAPDGSKRVVLSGADLDNNVARVYIFSEDGEVIETFGDQPVSADFYHTGLWQSWSCDGKRVFYKSGTEDKPLIVMRYLDSGKEVVIDGDMEGAPPIDTPIVSGLLGMLYAAGYGTGVYNPHIANVPFQARDKHGLFVYDMNTGKTELKLTINDILSIHPDRDKLINLDREMRSRFGDDEGLTLMSYCVRWDRSGENFMFHFGNHCQKRGEPRLCYLFSADKNLNNVNYIIDVGGESVGTHFNWHPDGKRLVGYYKPSKNDKFYIASVNIDGTNLTKLIDHSSGGHPSICPTNYNLLATDDTRYINNGFETSLGQVLLYDLTTGKPVRTLEIPQKNIIPQRGGRNPHRICHHPVFTNDGKKLFFNVLPGKNAHVGMIEI